MPVLAWLASVAAAGVYVVVINPTVGGAIVAGIFLTINTLLTQVHWRRLGARLDERHTVIVKGTPDDPETVIVTAEERRRLADDRAVPASSRPKTRKVRERRRRERRNDASSGP